MVVNKDHSCIDCLVFEKTAFCVRVLGDRQTQTNRRTASSRKAAAFASGWLKIESMTLLMRSHQHRLVVYYRYLNLVLTLRLLVLTH